ALEGTIVLEHSDSAGTRQRETNREGDVLLLPARAPHAPRRPASTVGLVVERLREPSEAESYAWDDERCDRKLYELVRGEGDMLQDLGRVAAEFNASESLRTCKACGYVQPVPEGPRL